MTLSALIEIFNTHYIQKRLRPTTARGYMVNFRLHILPALSESIELSEITVDTLDVLTDALFDKGLSAKSVLYVHASLRSALNFAVKRGYLAVSPYGAYDLPRVPKFRYTVLTPEQLLTFVNSLDGNPIRSAVVLAGFYGLRRGEILGIRPKEDYNPDTHTLHIQRTVTEVNRKEVITPCKTASSDRFVLIAPEDACIFTDCRTERLYQYTSSMLDHAFKRALASCEGLPRIRFHDLRHSYATWMMDSDINPKIVSSILGHSSVKVTLDLYSHPQVSMQARCLALIADKRNST